ncbi:MAG: L-serine ammonia-lyase [Parachlamydiaceae bacterium]
MAISAFNLYSIGIGPSSSHTVGPMRAALQAMQNCQNEGILSQTAKIRVDLYGSLALTGKGHATDIAVILGLSGETPEHLFPEEIPNKIETVRHLQQIFLLGSYSVPFDPNTSIVFHYDKQLPYHPNGMRFVLFDKENKELSSQIFYSVGGGFVVNHEAASKDSHLGEEGHKLPFPFQSADELLDMCRKNQMTIAELMMENEKSWRSEGEVKLGLLNIWNVMKTCIERGCQQEGILPGGLNVKRRAKGIYDNLRARSDSKRHVAEVMEWVSLWALAVNEENAAGGRVVTAPTNGAAGVIPAVLQYYMNLTASPSEEGVVTFMLVAAAVGILYKEKASISAAEMGCMGEVGVACSMAAAGLTAALGGTNEQVENAAEIGMEHNLGLTCDPIMGLVQIPCIERNTMGAIKAINASLLAFQGDGTHRVSLDQVIATMRETGINMNSMYKETSLGGLAVNVPEC